MVGRRKLRQGRPLGQQAPPPPPPHTLQEEVGGHWRALHCADEKPGRGVGVEMGSKCGGREEKCPKSLWAPVYSDWSAPL
jgi:hypothetical protein